MSDNSGVLSPATAVAPAAAVRAGWPDDAGAGKEVPVKAGTDVVDSATDGAEDESDSDVGDP